MIAKYTLSNAGRGRRAGGR